MLADSGLTVGDFVRWVRQVIDFAEQVADAAGPGALRRTARHAVESMRRGVVAFVPEVDPGGVTEAAVDPGEATRATIDVGLD